MLAKNSLCLFIHQATGDPSAIIKPLEGLMPDNLPFHNSYVDTKLPVDQMN